MVPLGNFLFRYRNALFPLAYLLLFWEHGQLFASDGLAAAIGVALALAGQILRAITIGLAYIIRGGRDRQVYAEALVQEGIFAHCRNPLYVGNFLILVGLGFIANSPLFLVVGVPVFALAYWAIIAAEEAFLERKFGDVFRDYCSRVNRLIPQPKGLGATLRSMEFRWRRLLVKEYGSTYAWIAGALLLALQNAWVHQGYAHARPAIWTLALLLLLATLLYAVSRYLKKAGIVIAD